ncbi:hypothetical protein RYX36_005024 [Vicia faba]
MALQGKDKGKANIGESSSNPAQDSKIEIVEPTLMSRRFLFNIRNRPLTPSKLVVLCPLLLKRKRFC